MCHKLGEEYESLYKLNDFAGTDRLKFSKRSSHKFMVVCEILFSILLILKYLNLTFLIIFHNMSDLNAFERLFPSLCHKN
jgi:hypothetical protein